MAEEGFRLTGGCQCGAVRYVLTALPTKPGVCHCRMCQRAGGAPFMAFGGVEASQIAWTGALKTYPSSTVAERGFCGECGTPLSYRLLGRDRVGVTLGSLDDPEAVRPILQEGVESRLSWADGIRDLPAETTPAQPDTFANHQHQG